MSLLDEAKASQKQRGPVCSVAIAKTARPELAADIDELVEAVHDKVIYATAAMRTVEKHDLAIKDEAFIRHGRRGTAEGCQCPVS